MDVEAIRDRLPAALVGGRLSVDVGASALPLGAATEATLALLKARGDLLGTEATLAALKARADLLAAASQLPAALVGGRLDVNVGATVGPLASQLPAALVGGRLSIADPPNLDLAATALRDALRGLSSKTLTDLDTRLATLATLLNAGLPAALVGGRLDVNVGASALPSGAATSAKQDTLQARADLLGTEATLAALKARGDLLGTEATLAALKARADLLLADATWTARFGEVQASPTANTLLARLKSVADLLNGGLPAALVSGRLDVNVGASVPATPLAGKTLQHYSARHTTNGTTTITSADAYLASVVVSIETGGTNSAAVVQDRQATALRLYTAATTAGATPATLALYAPLKATSGLDLVLSGAAAATVHVHASYWQ